MIFILYIQQSLNKQCSNPPPVANFQLSKFQGTWYEVGKIQTSGGAFFQKNCTCTKSSIYDKDLINIVQQCIKDGKPVQVQGVLYPKQIPGKFTQKLKYGQVGYWVVFQDQDSAITYDCTDKQFNFNYCVHFFSRNRTINPNKLTNMLDLVKRLQLNVNNLPFQKTNQTSCTNINLTQ